MSYNKSEWETSIVEIEYQFRQLAYKHKVAFSLFFRLSPQSGQRTL